MTRIMQTLRMAFSALLSNPFRTALTTLGIVIGIASVILLTSLGSGVQRQITGQIDNLGTNTLQVGQGQDAGDGPFSAAAAPTLTLADSRTVAGLPSINAASPVVSLAAPVAGRTVQLSGVDPAYASIRAVTLDAGRFLERPGEVVLAADLTPELTGVAPAEAIGRTVELRGGTYTVVGIAGAAAGGFGPAQAATTYLHVDDALRTTGGTTVGQIVAQARDSAAVDTAVTEIRAALTASHGGAEDFQIQTQAELLSSFTTITNLLTALLSGIAGISLVVGGIGIMNIMLVSVAERTREIGLRKALGATDGDVLQQFLFEAILLSLLGGLVGVGAGVGLAALASSVSSNLPTLVTATSVATAFGVAAAIGIIFGVLPAYRSAGLQPVEALRRE